MDLLLGLLIALIGTITTTAMYVTIVWRIDRYEKEPRRLLLGAFLWGMLPAVIVSLVVELLFSSGGLLDEIAIAPLVEESAKGFALLLLLVFAYREIDDVLDGIVYGAMIGLGFAFSENVLYVIGSMATDGLATGILVLFMRTVIFGVNHAFFASITGAAVGAARLTPGLFRRFVILFTGWMLAVIFHTIHNAGASLAGATNLASIGVSFASNWTGVLGVFILVVLAWHREERWMVEELAGEVDTGLLTRDEYAAITSSAGRQRLLARTLRTDGWASCRRLGQLYALLTELSFKKHELRLMPQEPATAEDIEHLRLAILGLRNGVDPQAGR